MTTFSSTSTITASPLSFNFWARRMSAARRRAKVCRINRELSSLSDEILRDIGLTRDEVHYLTRTGIEPSRLLY